MSSRPTSRPPDLLEKSAAILLLTLPSRLREDLVAASTPAEIRSLLVNSGFTSAGVIDGVTVIALNQRDVLMRLRNNGTRIHELLIEYTGGGACPPTKEVPGLIAALRNLDGQITLTNVTAEVTAEPSPPADPDVKPSYGRRSRKKK